MNVTMAQKLIISLTLACAMGPLGCAKGGDNASTGKADLAQEKDVTTKTLPDMAGSYKGHYGALIIRQDQTFTASLAKGLVYRIGPGYKPLKDYYVDCTSNLYGHFSFVEKYSALQKSRTTFLRLQISSADVVSSSAQNRGDKDLDALEICNRFVKSATANSLDLEASKVGTNALRVGEHYDEIRADDVQGEHAHFFESSSLSYKLGQLFGKVGAEADVTDYLFKFFAHTHASLAYAKDSVAGREFVFDSISHKISYRDNLCEFKVDATVRFILKDAQIRVVKDDFISTGSLADDRTKAFESDRARYPSWCDKDSAFMIKRDFEKDGFKVDLYGWSPLQISLNADRSVGLVLDENWR